MRFVTDLHNKHEGKEIFIAGSGPSLDEYPDDFLHGKLSITLHLAHLKFPEATYRHANELDRVRWFKENRGEYLRSKCIFAYPFYRRAYHEIGDVLNIDNPDYYWFILRPYPDPATVPMMVRDVRKGGRMDFGGHGSCLHASMYTAIMMGVKKITIIGCEHEPRGSMEHFSEGNRHNWYRAHSTPYAVKGLDMKEGTRLLIKACKKIRVEVDWKC